MTKRVQVKKNGKVVASAQNLEVILRYQRKNSYINRVTQNGRSLAVYYEDGAVCKTRFQSATVLRDWIASKRSRGVFPKIPKKEKMPSLTRKFDGKTYHLLAANSSPIRMLPFSKSDTAKKRAEWMKSHRIIHSYRIVQVKSGYYLYGR